MRGRVGVEVDRAGELARGPRVVARLREPLGAAEQARHHLGAGAAAPVVGERPLGDAHALEAPRRDPGAFRDSYDGRQREHRLPLLLRLRLAAALAQRPHEDRARVAVERVLLEHRAQLVLGAREVALPQQRPAQVEREVDGARLQPRARARMTSRRLRVRPASREAQERHRLVVQRGRRRARPPTSSREQRRPPRDSGRAAGARRLEEARGARLRRVRGHPRERVVGLLELARLRAAAARASDAPGRSPGDSPERLLAGASAPRLGVAGRERAAVGLQRGRRDGGFCAR